MLLLVGCGGTTVAPDDRQNGGTIGASTDVEEDHGGSDSGGVASDDGVEDVKTNIEGVVPGTSTTQQPPVSEDGTAASTTLPANSSSTQSTSTTTTTPITTTSVMKLRDFITAEPDAPGGFTGTVEPDA